MLDSRGFPGSLCSYTAEELEIDLNNEHQVGRPGNPLSCQDYSLLTSELAFFFVLSRFNRAGPLCQVWGKSHTAIVIQVLLHQNM